MSRISKRSIEKLNKKFLSALGSNVIKHSSISKWPLNIDLQNTSPNKIRVYLYYMTPPPLNDKLGGYRIELRVPGQKRGQYRSFNNKDDRYIIIAGCEESLGVFVFWDYSLYPKFLYRRNVYVKKDTVYNAFVNGISQQNRKIRSQGLETVIATDKNNSLKALSLRVEKTQNRLLEG